jgi:glycine/D-amino acid oxidase-like deaminating enzyme
MSIKGPACSKENTLLFDLEKGIGFERVNFDVCVIGAGAAGLVLATALAQRGIRTLLLEAGGRRYEARTQNLYLGEAAAFFTQGCMMAGSEFWVAQLHNGAAKSWNPMISFFGRGQFT